MKLVKKLGMLLVCMLAVHQSLHAWTFGFINDVKIPGEISKSVKVVDEQTGEVKVVRKLFRVYNPMPIKVKIKADAFGTLKSVQPATAGQEVLHLAYGQKNDNFFRYEVGHPEYCPGGLFSKGCVTWGLYAGACLESILVDTGSGLFQPVPIVKVPSETYQQLQQEIVTITSGALEQVGGMYSVFLPFKEITTAIVDAAAQSLCANRIFLIQADKKSGQLYAIMPY